MDVSFNLVNPVNPFQETTMKRLTTKDYSVDAVTAAKALVGAWLCRRLEDGTIMQRRITETEAYCGEEDTACHAHKGRTARTDVMYASGGCAYIYLCYGMHEMLNVVTGPEGRPEAVLIRGVEDAEGLNEQSLLHYRLCTILVERLNQCHYYRVFDASQNGDMSLQKLHLLKRLV